jgi:hypothetical protein
MTDSERAFLTVSELEDLAALASWHIFEAARLMEWGDMSEWTPLSNVQDVKGQCDAIC